MIVEQMFGPGSDDASSWSQFPATSTVQCGSNAINTTGPVAAGTVSATGAVNGAAGLTANTNLAITHDATNGGKIMTKTMSALGIGTNNTATAIQVSASGNVGIGKAPTIALDVAGQVSCTEVNCSSNANISGSAYITGDASISGNFETTNIQNNGASNLMVFNKRTGALGGNTLNGYNLGRIDFNGWNTTSQVGAQILARQEGTAATGVPCGLQFYTSNGTTTSERMTINKDGMVGIGATPLSPLYCYESGTSGWKGRAWFGNENTGVVMGAFSNMAYIGGHNTSFGAWTDLIIQGAVPGNVGIGTALTAPTAKLEVVGSFKASSKSFQIPHPLPSMEDTHYLVHNCIEAPQADLQYRGKVSLVEGKAVINIDIASGMTEGTFEALCRDVQCFTSNESDWIHVRGKVEGNILTIEAQDTSAASLISWLVIGERKDKHMMESAITDDEGRVIVEPLKGAPPS